MSLDVLIDGNGKYADYSDDKFQKSYEDGAGLQELQGKNITDPDVLDKFYSLVGKDNLPADRGNAEREQYISSIINNQPIIAQNYAMHHADKLIDKLDSSHQMKIALSVPEQSYGKKNLKEDEKDLYEATRKTVKDNRDIAQEIEADPEYYSKKIEAIKKSKYGVYILPTIGRLKPEDYLGILLQDANRDSQIALASYGVPEFIKETRKRVSAATAGPEKSIGELRQKREEELAVLDNSGGTIDEVAEAKRKIKRNYESQEEKILEKSSDVGFISQMNQAIIGPAYQAIARRKAEKVEKEKSNGNTRSEAQVAIAT